MIDPKELRIGNLVILKPYPEEIAQIIVINFEEWNVRALFKEANFENYTQEFEALEPIPITPEWLERMGFMTMDYEYDVIEWARPDTELKFSLTQSGIPVEQQPFTFYFDQGMGDVEVEIKHVHQLQNLYFALTGEEIKINELV